MIFSEPWGRGWERLQPEIWKGLIEIPFSSQLQMQPYLHRKT